jgi:hypothetical protein
LTFCKIIKPIALLNIMKTTPLIALFAFAITPCGLAFDVEKASTQRFKVSYVSPKELPALAVIPKQFSGRDEVLKTEREAIEAGTTTEELNRFRRIQLEHYYFPIRVTDSQNGNIYEVQSDRRTIIAKTKNGELIWKVSPNAGTYRVEHPFIVYFGRSTSAVAGGKGDRFLGIAFNSSVFGQIDLTNGSFHHEGND